MDPMVQISWIYIRDIDFNLSRELSINTFNVAMLSHLQMIILQSEIYFNFILIPVVHRSIQHSRYW